MTRFLHPFFQDHDLSKIPALKSKDAVNNFLKTASKLTSIEENSELSSGSEATMRHIPGAGARGQSRSEGGSSRSQGDQGGSSRSSMSTTPSIPSIQSSSSKRLSRASDLPTLGQSCQTAAAICVSIWINPTAPIHHD